MDNDVANSADITALYKAAGIDPRLSIEEAAEHLAHLGAENKRLADAVERQTLLSTMSIDQGALNIEVIPPREVVIHWVLAARNLLGTAENYSETPVELPPSVEMGIGTAGERYVVTVQRPGRLTPHEARRRAETERAQIRDAVLALADEQDQAAADLRAQGNNESNQATDCASLAQRLREIAGQT